MFYFHNISFVTITKMILQSKHNNIFNNMKFATCFGYK